MNEQTGIDSTRRLILKGAAVLALASLPASASA